MSEVQGRNWYVLRAIGGKEKKVKEYIETEVRTHSLQELVSQVLIPTEKVYSIRNGKKISKERISFPGYILVEAVLEGDIPHMLRNTPDVLGFLGTPGSSPLEAIPLRPHEVARLLGQVDEMAVSEEIHEVPFIVGETVKVNDGPFATLSGVIEEIDSARRKLVVSVKIFGRKTPMELNFTQVEKE
ncbi:MAG: transcription termination/antitermination protein NusG [Rikenellaceae bacterium]